MKECRMVKILRDEPNLLINDAYLPRNISVTLTHTHTHGWQGDTRVRKLQPWQKVAAALT